MSSRSSGVTKVWWSRDTVSRVTRSALCSISRMRETRAARRFGVVEVAQQLDQGNAALDDVFRVLIEEGEEAPFPGHESREQLHPVSPRAAAR